MCGDSAVAANRLSCCGSSVVVASVPGVGVETFVAAMIAITESGAMGESVSSTRDALSFCDVIIGKPGQRVAVELEQPAERRELGKPGVAHAAREFGLSREARNSRGVLLRELDLHASVGVGRPLEGGLRSLKRLRR